MLAVILIFCGIITSCSNDDTSANPPQQEHTLAVTELIRICEQHTEVKQLLEHAIQQAATINPDPNYNPAQT